MQETGRFVYAQPAAASGTVQFDRRPASVDRAGRAPNDFAQGGPAHAPHYEVEDRFKIRIRVADGPPDGGPEDPGDAPEDGHGREPGGGRVLVDDLVEGRD